MNPTHAILTYSKIHYLVNKDQAETAAMLKAGDERMIGGNLIKGSNISDIITIEKYYETFPEKRPPQMNMFDPKKLERPMGINGIIRETNSVFALEQIAKGIKKYMASTEKNPVMPNSKDPRWFKGTDNPGEILEKIENKIKSIKLNQI